jgi:iron complex transport system ATP-binding protein
LNDALITAAGVTLATRDGRALVDDVSITVAAGERLAIIGPNGAGKTTLLRILAGIQKPSAGTVSFVGRNLAGMRPAERARSIALVGQTDLPDHRVKLWDYVGLGRVPHSGVRGRVEEWGIIRDALRRTGLEHFRDRSLGTLSGGERQRAQIARALAQEPRLLLLDEPTNHLDPRARGDLLRLVATLDLTVVAVLHDLALVPMFATSVAIMTAGRLLATGSVEAVLTPENIRTVFAVDVLRLRHPAEDRDLTVFDIPYSQAKGV